MSFCSVQDAVNSLTLFKYLCLIMHCYIKTSIDGSIFYLYYLYCLSIFQRTCRFRFKSGCKGKRFIFNYQTFSEVFFYFFSFLLISQTLLRKGKNNHKRKSKTALFANRTAKIKTFIYMFQTFSELFCFIIKRAYALSLSHLSRLSSLGKRVQK